MLTTERLTLRQFTPDDAQDLYEYLSLPEIYRYEPGGPITLAEARKLAEERSNGTNIWAVTVKVEGKEKMIGHVMLCPVQPKHFLTWEIGYIFSPAFQNKGYATEAAKALIGYAFKEQGAHRVIGYCDQENTASYRVMEKCGMRRECTLSKNVYSHMNENWQPRRLDSYGYAILEEDYSKNSR